MIWDQKEYHLSDLKRPEVIGLLIVFAIILIVPLAISFSRNFQVSTVSIKDFEVEHVKFIEYKPDADKEGVCFAFIGYQKPGEWFVTSNMMMAEVECKNPTVAAGLVQED
jgi:hypothetical protein